MVGSGRLGGCTDVVSSPAPVLRGAPRGEEGAGQIYNAEDKDHAVAAAKAFNADYGTTWPTAVAKVIDDLDVLLTFYDFPVEHWIHLRTTNPIESTFATVRLRTRATKGPGSRRPASERRSSAWTITMTESKLRPLRLPCRVGSGLEPAQMTLPCRP